MDQYYFLFTFLLRLNNTAPKTSQAIISRKRLSQLLGREDTSNNAKPETDSTPATSLHIREETRKDGEIGIAVAN